MAAPTRTQIQLDVTFPATRVLLNFGAGDDVSADVISVTTRVETSGDGAGNAWGTIVRPTATVEIDTALLNTAWAGRKIRIAHTFSGADWVSRFEGWIVERQDGDDGATWACRGHDYLIEGTPVRSPLFRSRPVATLTTSGSVEDPDDPDYVGGLINYILWTCGLRPYEQAGDYPSANAYYSCSEALIAPAWAWADGSDAWQLLQRLCRCAGGQLYQGVDGVVRYVDPITLASGTALHHFTDTPQTAAQRAANNTAHYGSISRRHDVTRRLDGVTATFTRRAVAPIDREVFARGVFVRVPPQVGMTPGTATVVCDLQLPVRRVAEVDVDLVVIRSQRPPVSGVTTTTTLDDAQRVTVTVTNTTADPVQIDRVTITGRPLEPQGDGSAAYVADPTGRIKTLEDNPFVSTARHGEQLCRMVYDVLASGETTITLGDVPYDPDRYIGELVLLTYSGWPDMTGVTHRIVGLQPQDGEWMTVELAPVAGLPTLASVHRVGLITATTLRLGY